MKLTKNQTKAYSAIHFGYNYASDIIQNRGMRRATAYKVLRELIDYGLVRVFKDANMGGLNRYELTSDFKKEICINYYIYHNRLTGI